MRALAMLLAAAAPAAAADLVINHSGRLTAEDDAPVTATSGLAMIFAIYAAESASSEETTEWDETYTVPVYKGVYTVDLGSRAGGKKALPSTVFPSGASRFLQITVAGQAMSPRLRIGTVPQAGVARDVDCAACISESELGFTIDTVIGDKEILTNMLDDAAVTDLKLHDGAVTAAKLAPNAVTAVKILDGEVTDAKIDSLSASKITGGVGDAQIAALSASKLVEGTAAGLNASRLLGQVQDAQIAGVSSAKIGGLITTTQIDKLATTQLDGQIADSQIAAVAGSKVTAPLDGSKLGGTVNATQLATHPLSDFVLKTDLPALGTANNPARSCRGLRGRTPALASGPYLVAPPWIDPTLDAALISEQCDMTSDGGGWTRCLAWETQITGPSTTDFFRRVLDASIGRAAGKVLPADLAANCNRPWPQVEYRVQTFLDGNLRSSTRFRTGPAAFSSTTHDNYAVLGNSGTVSYTSVCFNGTAGNVSGCYGGGGYGSKSLYTSGTTFADGGTASGGYNYIYVENVGQHPTSGNNWGGSQSNAIVLWVRAD